MTEIKANSRTELFLKILAPLIAIGIIVSSIIFIVFAEGFKDDEEIVSIQAGWVDAQGNHVNLERIITSESNYSVFIDIDEVELGHELLFLVRNMYVDVYQDGVLVGEDEVVEHAIYGKSPGARWHIVPLNAATNTKIELRCTACYENAKGYISRTAIGTSEDLFKDMSEKLMPLVMLNVVWSLFSLSIIAFYIIFRNYYHIKHEMFYLGLAAFFCSLWCGIESNVWQFYYGHSEGIHLVGYLSLLLIPVTVNLFFTERLSGKWRKGAEIFTGLSELFTLIAYTLHAIGVVDLHYSVRGSHIFIAALFPFAIKVLHEYSLDEVLKKHKMIINISFAAVGVCIFLGIFRYSTGHYEDYASYIRIALFAFLCVLLAFQLAGVNRVFVKGIQAEFVKEIAMLDHLTKFYNRTGYAEHRDEYENATMPIGILQFDINNLKEVNDNQGHEKGDELICLASSGISESFGAKGRCYRMGGDEFLVVLNGTNPEADYKAGMANFKTYCSQANSVPDKTFELAVACGFKLKRPGESMQEAIDIADGLMYENKKQMKAGGC